MNVTVAKAGAVANRIDELKACHAALETEIKDEAKRPRPDDLKLQRLKRKRLKVKDELALLVKGAA